MPNLNGIPNYSVDILNADGSMNLSWYRFFANLGTIGSIIPSGLEIMEDKLGIFTPNGANNWVHQATLTQNSFIAPPPNPSFGKTLIIQVIQNTAGGHSLGFSSFYKGISSLSYSTLGSTQATFCFQVQPDGLTALLLLQIMNGNPIA